MKKYFVIKGRKWFDKVNGNTYNSAKVYDMNKEKTFYIDFEYGYGFDYYYRACRLIQEILNVKVIDHKTVKIFDVGAEYDTKKNVKNFNY